jgi:hypothetical protein
LPKLRSAKPSEVIALLTDSFLSTLVLKGSHTYFLPLERSEKVHWEVIALVIGFVRLTKGLLFLLKLAVVFA